MIDDLRVVVPRTACHVPFNMHDSVCGALLACGCMHALSDNCKACVHACAHATAYMHACMYVYMHATACMHACMHATACMFMHGICHAWPRVGSVMGGRVCMHAYAGILLTPEQAMDAKEAGETFLLGYQTLAYHAIEKGICGWKLRPKLHMLAHIVDNLGQSLENPIHLSNFMDEDLMGKLVKLARKQHRSVCVCRGR
jgi:hypothetical protein